MKNIMDEERDAVLGAIAAMGTRLKIPVDSWTALTESVEGFLDEGHEPIDLIDTRVTDDEEITLTLTQEAELFFQKEGLDK